MGNLSINDGCSIAMFHCRRVNSPTWKKHRSEIITIKVWDDPLPRLITRGKWVKTMAIAHICLDIYPNGYNMLQPWLYIPLSYVLVSPLHTRISGHKFK